MTVTPFPAPGARGYNWAGQLTEAIETRDQIIKDLAEGRVTADQVPAATVRGLLSGGSNLDAMRTAAHAGSYQLSSSASYPGAPVGLSGAATLEVIPASGAVATQRITQAGQNFSWQRSYLGSWSAWSAGPREMGFRNISTLLQNGWAGSAYVQRSGQAVQLVLAGLDGANATGGTFLALPTGLRPWAAAVGVFERFLLHRTDSTPTLRRGSISAAGNATLAGWTTADVLHGSLIYITPDAFPTTPPGTPA